MKWKQNIGKIINGFEIIDSYIEIGDNGGKLTRVKLKCLRCGAIFERSQAISIEHVKCKCMCVDYGKPEPIPRKTYEYQGKKYHLPELSKLCGVDSDKIWARLRQGVPIEIAIQKEFTRICPICDKEFKTDRINRTYCSPTCAHRNAKGRGKYNPDYLEIKHYVCECCGTSFDSNHPKARFCSDKCRKAAARLERRKKLKNVRERGEFDVSVTLENVYEKFGGKCVCCGKSLKFGDSPLTEDYPTIDHIKPLSKGGAHLWNNVQLMCRACNMSKGAKYDDRQAEATV